MNGFTRTTSPVITLTTDFGWRDGYVGTMKGVILSLNPSAIIVDITHDVEPQNIEEGGFLFAASASYFPSNTIHVVVVDPGVGSERRAIAIQVGQSFFVAPDNGVLTQAIAALRSGTEDAQVQAVHLNRPEYWLPRVSATFHGRDLFAPVAAHLSLGVPLQALGEPISDWIQLARATAAFRTRDGIVGHVIHIDGAGNIVTDIGEKLLVGTNRARVTVRIAGRTIRGIKTTFADVGPGEMLAFIGSSGTLEIAVREGNAAERLGIRTGAQVDLTLDTE